MCLEDWNGETVNRVFTWGFGGYGRLGHQSADDEVTPRELTYFSRAIASTQVNEKTIDALSLSIPRVKFNISIYTYVHFDRCEKSSVEELTLVQLLLRKISTSGVNCPIVLEASLR